MPCLPARRDALGRRAPPYEAARLGAVPLPAGGPDALEDEFCDAACEKLCTVAEAIAAGPLGLSSSFRPASKAIVLNSIQFRRELYRTLSLLGGFMLQDMRDRNPFFNKVDFL